MPLLNREQHPLTGIFYCCTKRPLFHAGWQQEIENVIYGDEWRYISRPGQFSTFGFESLFMALLVTVPIEIFINPLKKLQKCA